MNFEDRPLAIKSLFIALVWLIHRFMILNDLTQPCERGWAGRDARREEAEIPEMHPAEGSHSERRRGL